LKERAKTEDISSYFVEFCQDCLQQGVKKLSIILDNNTTHKKKMKNQLQTPQQIQNTLAHICSLTQ
jgi:hypothetical protein